MLFSYPFLTLQVVHVTSVGLLLRVGYPGSDDGLLELAPALQRDLGQEVVDVFKSIGIKDVSQGTMPVLDQGVEVAPPCLRVIDCSLPAISLSRSRLAGSKK